MFKIAALTKQFMNGDNHNRLSLKMFKNGKKQTSGSLKGPPSEAQSKALIIPLQKPQNERSHNVKSFLFFIWQSCALVTLFFTRLNLTFALTVETIYCFTGSSSVHVSGQYKKASRLTLCKLNAVLPRSITTSGFFSFAAV